MKSSHKLEDLRCSADCSSINLGLDWQNLTFVHLLSEIPSIAEYLVAVSCCFVPISQSARPLVSIMQPYYVHANSIPYNGLQNEQTLSIIPRNLMNGSQSDVCVCCGNGFVSREPFPGDFCYQFNRIPFVHIQCTKPCMQWYHWHWWSNTKEYG